MEQYITIPNMEYIYSFIAYLVDYNPLLFRLTILLPAYIFLLYIFKSQNYNYQYLIIYILFFLATYSTIIRSFISDTLFFGGIIAFFHKKNLLTLIIMSILILLSIIFHKSTFLLIIPLVTAFLQFNINTYKRLLYCIPLFIILATLLLDTLVDLLNLTESAYLSKADMDVKDIRLWIIRKFMDLLSFIYYSYLLFVNKKILTSDSSLNIYMYRFLFISYIIYVILYFLPTADYVYQRFYGHLCIPLLFIISYGITKKNIKFIFVTKYYLIISIIYRNFEMYRLWHDHSAIINSLNI